MADYKLEEKLEDYYNQIYNDLETKTLENEFGNYVLSRLNTAKRKVYNKTQTEIRNFDMSFLDAIESCYPALLKIMRDPKRSIRYEQEIVAVEKAKKVNSDTVRHLASHTHLIKEVNDDNVVPAKVLSTFAEEELAIYENRFIKSLVKRIEIYLQRRYEVMKASLDSFDSDHLNVENDFLMSGKNVNVKLDIEIKEIFTKDIEATKKDYQRLLYVKDLIQNLKGSEFMRALAKTKDVLPPIMKTNIILHNPDFKMCYNLWLYLDKTDGIAFDIDIKEKSFRYTEILNKDLNQAITLALSAFIRSRQIAGIVPSKQKNNLKAPKAQPNPAIDEIPNLEPKNEKLEDYRMNEYLLSRTAAYYEATFDGMQRSGSTESESLRVVYRQMLDMLDQIYPKVFNVSDEELDSMDLYQRLDYMRKRHNVLKVVQQQKQMNIARMGKGIKKCERDILSIEKKIKLKEARARALEKRRLEKEAKARLTKAEKQALKEQEKARITRIIKEKKAHEQS